MESEGEKSEGEGELVVDDPSPAGSASSYDRQVGGNMCDPGATPMQSPA